jgi:hypothetical protein
MPANNNCRLNDGEDIHNKQVTLRQSKLLKTGRFGDLRGSAFSLWREATFLPEAMFSTGTADEHPPDQVSRPRIEHYRLRSSRWLGPRASDTGVLEASRLGVRG